MLKPPLRILPDLQARLPAAHYAASADANAIGQANDPPPDHCIDRIGELCHFSRGQLQLAARVTNSESP
jgi:hypothetical protein